MEKRDKSTKEQIFEYGGISYKEKIIEMVREIEDEKYIKMIYGFINQCIHNK